MKNITNMSNGAIALRGFEIDVAEASDQELHQLNMDCYAVIMAMHQLIAECQEEQKARFERRHPSSLDKKGVD